MSTPTPNPVPNPEPGMKDLIRVLAGISTELGWIRDTLAAIKQELNYMR